MDDPEFKVSSSGSDELDNLEGALSNFRDAWQKEIANENDNNKIEDNVATSSCQDDVETQARKFFMDGAENEKKGLMYEAIQSYRKAVQLVPDIEFKIFEAAKKQNEEKTAERNIIPDEMDNELEHDVDLELDLCNRFQSLYSKSFTVCLPAQDPRGAHFSSLPLEIVLLIFRWVVSKDLDVRSLEMCSMVCRGFYLCTRDSELWRSICVSQFGTDCGKLDNSLSWRDTYLQKPHLHFNGCYISKASYFRQGEKCFQDQFHRPWHVVEYYRYLRYPQKVRDILLLKKILTNKTDCTDLLCQLKLYVPSLSLRKKVGTILGEPYAITNVGANAPVNRIYGVVLMVTTPDAPGPILNHLRHRNPKIPSVLVGRYRLSEDRVSMVFHRSNTEQNTNRRRGRNRPAPEFIQQKYNIELSLKAPKSRNRSVLVWNKYTVFTISNFTDTMANFDLPPNKFPPFFFSRVKSYSIESESQL